MSKRMSCLIHVGPQCNSEDIRPFNNDKWKKIQDIAEKRRKHFSKRSKYNPLLETLPSTYTDLDGFHRSCYKNFTAIPALKQDNSEPPSINPQANSRTKRQPATCPSSSGIFPKKCIICKAEKKRMTGYKGHKGCKGRKKVFEKLSKCQTVEAQREVIIAAEDLEDQGLLLEIDNVDFIAKEVQYHDSCKKNYIAKAKWVDEGPSEVTSAHEKAINVIKTHIDYIISDNKAVLLPTIHELYLEVLSDNGFPNPTYSSQSLEHKLLSLYHNNINIHKLSSKYGKVVYRRTLIG